MPHFVSFAADPWGEWGRVFTDPTTWRPVIEEIWRRHRLGRPGEIVPGFPGSNAVFIVDDARVVKIAWPFERQSFYRELELYRLLEPYRTTLLTPELLRDHRDGRLIEGVVEGWREGEPDGVVEGWREGEPDWPYFVMERLPGERLGEVWPQVPREDQIAIAGQLGRMTRALHEVPLAGITAMETSRDAWHDFVERRVAACIRTFREEGGLPSHLVEQVPGYLADAQPLFPNDFTPVILNGDITCDHELLSVVDGHWRIAGFIDFGDALVGHSEYEFTCVHLGTFSCDAELTRVFLQAYGWDGWQAHRFSRRMMAYCLLHPYFEFDTWIVGTGVSECVRSLEELEVELWGAI